MQPALLLLTALTLAAEPVLPVLVEQVPPAWPPEALDRGERASVLLELDVLADGRVLAARVIESGGEGFDRAAVGAARSFVFEPGRDASGRPVPVTILYRMVFEPEAAPPLSVEGRVREAGTRRLLAGVDVVLERDGRQFVAITDEEGRFRAAGLEDGAWSVGIDAPGYRAEPATVDVRLGRVAEVTLYPVVDRPWEAGADGVSEVVEVVGRRTAPEITERLLDQEEIRYLPGTNGDVVRVVQNLPGVARAPLNIGQLPIRGTAPEDSAYYLDGAQIPIVFHFAGLSTVLNGDLVDEIAFLPGNYGVRYGRTLGGAVDLRLDPELPERSRGYVSVDLFQASAFVEQRVGPRTSLSVSGRRSYADTFLGPALASVSASTIRVPRYYDLQARMLGETRSGGTLDVLILLSDDRFSVIGEDADGAEQVQIGLTTAFQKIRLLSRETLEGGWRNELSVIGGSEAQTFDLAPSGEAWERPFTFAAREELYKAAPDGVGLGWRIGLDTQAGRFAYLYDVDGFGAAEGADVLRLAPAAYVEPTLALGDLELVPGLRVDGLILGSGYEAIAVDPRFAARYDLGTTTLKGSAGGYSQFPTVRQAVERPSLGPQRSWQLSAGVEQRLGPSLSAELTGFHNTLTDLVSGREDAFRFFTGPPPGGPLDTGPYANVGTGRIYGLEALVRWSDERTAAWIGATLSRSTRLDRPDGERELFVYDQPVVLTALVSHELPRRWRLGARARYGSGNPYTPVVNRFIDLDRREFVPVYGARDSERLPSFWSLDLRIDKDYVFKGWTLTTYLDLQNATNAQNVEVQGYTYDYSEEDPVTSIPIVPAFGLRGEW